MLQVDVQVFSPSDDVNLPASVFLVIQTLSASAGKWNLVVVTIYMLVVILVGGSDYREINADVFLMFDNNSRRQSFVVDILDDQLFEDAENFMLELRFDSFEEPRSNVILSPSVTAVHIVDNDGITDLTIMSLEYVM